MSKKAFAFSLDKFLYVEVRTGITREDPFSGAKSSISLQILPVIRPGIHYLLQIHSEYLLHSFGFSVPGVSYCVILKSTP